MSEINMTNFQRMCYAVSKYDNGVCKAEIDKLILTCNYAKDMLHNSYSKQIMNMLVAYCEAFIDYYKDTNIKK